MFRLQRLLGILIALGVAACSPRPALLGESPPASPASASPAPTTPAPSPSPPPAASPGAPAPTDLSAYYACGATVTRPAPPSGGKQTVRVRSNTPQSPVALSVTYGGGRAQSLSGTLDPAGRAEFLFRTLAGIRSGTNVKVDVVVAGAGRCSTTFVVG